MPWLSTVRTCLHEQPVAGKDADTHSCWGEQDGGFASAVGLNELAVGVQVRGGLDHYAHVLNQQKRITQLAAYVRIWAGVITSGGNRNPANAEVGMEEALQCTALMHQAWQPLLPSPDASVAYNQVTVSYY
jgi:hypothetical protein